MTVFNIESTSNSVLENLIVLQPAPTYDYGIGKYHDYADPEGKFGHKILNLNFSSSVYNANFLKNLASAIPDNFTGLVLGPLDSINTADIAYFLSRIPTTIKAISLDAFTFNKRTAKEIARIFSALPPHLISFAGWNKFLENMTNQELILLAQSLPMDRLLGLLIGMNINHPFRTLITTTHQDSIISLVSQRLGNAPTSVVTKYLLNFDEGIIQAIARNTYIPSIPRPILLEKMLAAQNHLDAALETLAEKRTEFYLQNELIPFNTAKRLHQTLERLVEDYHQGPQSERAYNAFKTKCESYIEDARPLLENDVGVKQILANIALAIAGLGIFYLLAIVINKAVNGNFLFFPPTDAKSNINVINESLNQFAPEGL